MTQTKLICTICGEENQHPHLSEEVCHGCGFWQEKILLHAARPHVFIIAKSIMYFLHEKPEERMVDKATFRGFLGYGGADWKLKFFDTGEVVVTNNLWCNGCIPERWRPKLKDNCKLISRYKYEGEYPQTQVEVEL